MEKVNMKKIKEITIMLTVILCITILLTGCIDNGVKTLSNKFYVNHENDNGRTFTVENSEVGYGNENGSWALLQLSTTYNFGVRFNNINIKKGSEIKTAYIELYSVGTPYNRHPNCKIYCDDTANASNFKNIGVLDICGRNYTDEYALWNESQPFGEWVKTPSLVGPIQEVINREDWESENSMAFLFITQRIKGYSASFENYDNGYPPRLYIEWEE
jgi:hypothetical protein